jgi:hypothetical protein
MYEGSKARWIGFGEQDGNRDGLGQVEIRFREHQGYSRECEPTNQPSFLFFNVARLSKKVFGEL